MSGMCLVVFSRVLTLKVHCLYIPCAVRGAYAIKRGEVNFVAVVDKAYTCCLQALLKTTDGAELLPRVLKAACGHLKTVSWEKRRLPVTIPARPSKGAGEAVPVTTPPRPSNGAGEGLPVTNPPGSDKGAEEELPVATHPTTPHEPGKEAEQQQSLGTVSVIEDTAEQYRTVYPNSHPLLEKFMLQQRERYVH